MTPVSGRVHLPSAGSRPPVPTAGASRPVSPRGFHRTMPGYAATAARSLPQVAAGLGVGEVWVKDESSRLGLPSFKVLGGSWAVHRALMERVGEPFAERGFADLVAVAAGLGPLTLTTATDGNHGRGVARVARLLGLDSVVYVPDDMVPARIAGIESEGARVVVHDGDYDAAVARSAAAAEEHGWLSVADVAYDGADPVPRWVIEGYDTIFAECDEQLPGPVTTLLVQAGVGALAGAALQHYALRGHGTRCAVVEPLQAACLLESAVSGGPISLASSQGSAMAGLNCGTPSAVAWPWVHACTDVYLAVADARAFEAMQLLAAAGIESGESGAAGLAGLLEVGGDPTVRAALGLDQHARVLVVNTEGATDPEAYRRIVAPD